MQISASDPLATLDQGSTTGAIGSGAAADAIADHEQDTSGAHTATGISIVNGALGVAQWPMLGLSSGTAVAGPYFGGATNVQQALEYLANAINALTGGSPGVARHWPMLALSQGGGGALPITSWLSTLNGGGEIVRGHGSLGSTETIDLGDGSYHWGTLNANCTFTFTVLSDTRHRWFTLELIEDGPGGWTVTWPGSVTWLGGAVPTHTTTAGTTTIYAFFTRNGGTTWIGGQLGAGGFTSPLTTKGDVWGYDTADARVPVGANGEFLRADSTDAQGVAWQTADLDDLSDVTITSPADGERLRHNGSAWVNSSLIHRPVMVEDPSSGNWFVVVTGDGDAVMVEA